VAARSRAAGRDNPYALDLPDPGDEDYEVTPLRPYDCAPVTDGAAAIVLATGDKARELCERPAWIRGVDHRIEAHALGARDLGRSESAELAGRKAGVRDIEVAELHAQFSHEELILREALGLGDDVRVNPSGGPLAANPVMATGLIRIGEAAGWIHRGEANRTLAHASSGPCLQSNLVCVMEA
jgi:acetyl-CoA acetyltransferase